MNIKSSIAAHINIYRIIVAAGIITASVLSLSIAPQMLGHSSWAYYFGVENFASGDFVIDDALHSEQVAEAKAQGGTLAQYVEIGDDQWALEKAPGYVLYLVPFEWLGIPRWGNVFLAIGMTLVTYILLKRLKNEKTACIGSLLMLFTPISLIMLNITYMNTFASLAFIVMGGGLYIYYELEREKLSRWAAGIILFLSFLLASWSVVVCYTNFLIVAAIALHFVVTRAIAFHKGNRKNLFLESGFFILGNGIPVAVLLIYNYCVFGSIFDYGYHYSSMPTSFSLESIFTNIANAPASLLSAFPLLLIAVPAFGIILYRKYMASKKPAVLSGGWAGLGEELPWDILWLLTGWFIGGFCLYLAYDFTAEYVGSHTSFIRFARYYLPGLFPIVIISSLVMDRFPRWILYPVMGILIVAGIAIYIGAVA
jgi:hypothetical protein